jgi:hypothetical protein
MLPLSSFTRLRSGPKLQDSREGSRPGKFRDAFASRRSITALLFPSAHFPTTPRGFRPPDINCTVALPLPNNKKRTLIRVRGSPSGSSGRDQAFRLHARCPNTGRTAGTILPRCRRGAIVWPSRRRGVKRRSAIPSILPLTKPGKWIANCSTKWVGTRSPRGEFGLRALAKAKGLGPKYRRRYVLAQMV